MKKHACLPMLLLASACASGPPTGDELADQQYHRDAARIEAAEAFERKKEACERRAGAVVVRRTFSRRIRSSIPEVRLATCVPGRPGTIF
ncbi:MAG TPA: hypothetical protein VFG91_11320 [Woeseiaceae bacterium]|nr:hypothetical protein [Woeseiaceae bacterium]